MSGNTFGQLFSLTSFGESHGPAIGGVVDGCPPGLNLDEKDLQIDLDRRKPGTSKYVTQRKEDDAVEILSGIFEGKTTGAPIGFIIKNKDQRSQDYSKIKDTFRPGHADFTYQQKYGVRDYRGGGRSSARETAVRVAAGAIAKKWLKESLGVTVRGCLTQLGEEIIPVKDWDEVNNNPFFAADPSITKKLADYLDTIMSRITLPGSLFLGLVAILPAFAMAGGINMQFAQFYGGTSLLILVGVILDTLQQIESHLLMRHYDGLMDSGRIKGKSSGSMM